MEYMVIPDTAIIAVNRGRRENESSNLVYRDESGRLHSIDFETCAKNFRAAHKDSAGNCIGERNIAGGCFIFYTSGIMTRILFDKIYVGRFPHRHLISGTKSARFLALQKLIREANYTTYDLS